MKLKNTLSIIFFIYICFFLIDSNADRIKNTMYIKINGSIACYRRMNSTHQIGCSSNRGGSTGIVHYCDTQSDLSFIFKNGSAERYIPILPTKLFGRVFADIISNQHKVAGLILYPSNDEVDYFSHDKTCPNNNFNVEGTCPNAGWNPWGTSLLFRDIPFPMFFIEDKTSITAIKECFQKFNNFSFQSQNDRSLCSLELNSFMYATTNTQTCKRRSNIVTNLNPVKLCDPLGDSNVWGSLFPLVEDVNNDTRPVKNFEYIVIAARMDTTSLFDATAGAESPITGIVTLLTIAKLLKEMLPHKETDIKKNVLFILFNGETYDYIGSQRLLYDMERGEFPTDLPVNNDILPTIYPKDISLFIELSQVAPAEGIYAHYLTENERVLNFIDNLKRNTAPNRSVIPTPTSLPPSSLHTFIRANSSFNGLVLANHRKEYRNHFYNSLYDNASNIGYQYYNGSEIGSNTVQSYIGDLALTVARSVYEDVTGSNYTGKDVTVDLNLIDELFHCYLEDPNCKLHKAIQKGDLPKNVLSLYVGVDVIDNFFTTLVALTMAWFIGEDIGPSAPNCTNLNKNHVFRYYNMSSSIQDLQDMRCYKVTVNITEAVSPAFLIEDYDWSSNKYSSWSESTWNSMGMRMFLRPSPAHERMTLALGSLVMVFFFVVVYFMKTRSHVLFDLPVPDLDDPPTNC